MKVTAANMRLTCVALFLFILPLCVGLSSSEVTLTSGPSEPTLTVHEAAITASCVTSLIATSVSCWTVTAGNKALAVQTPAPAAPSHGLSSDVEKREEPEQHKFISCIQLYATGSSCAIGVHPQPTLDGHPTSITITTSPSADATPVTSTLAMTAAMSVGIVDATLINPAGDTWEVVWTDEVRDRIVEIANNYCGLPVKGKRRQQLEARQDETGALVPRDLDRITCNMRNLEAGLQQSFQEQVTNEVLQNVAVELPVAAVDAFASTGLTTLQIQRAAAAVVGVTITGVIIAGFSFVGTSQKVRKEDVLRNVPQFTATITPTKTSTTSSSSSSSSSSSTTQMCPLCTACAPIRLNEEEGQIGASIPTRPGVPVAPTTTTSPPYSCHSAAHEIETITFNKGPWCDCPDGQFSTSESLITSGSVTITNNCAYTTPAPASLSWYPRAHNLASVSCAQNYGIDLGMVREDFSVHVIDFCWGASTHTWNAYAHIPTFTRYPPTVNYLLDGPKPTYFAAVQEVSIPEVKKKKERLRMAIQVRYEREACEDPRDPSEVAFSNKKWCEEQLGRIFDEEQCKFSTSCLWKMEVCVYC